jgi:hypothetical protein
MHKKIKTLTLKDAISYALETKADAKKAKLKVKTANTKFRKFVRERYLKFLLTDR